MKIPKGGVAFFDSGIGGLTVLTKCREYLPNTLFYYYGDNRHAPYGNLPVKKIRRYVKKAFALFARLKVRAVVIACNTVTAVCIDELRKRYPFPIIGTEPAVRTAAKLAGETFVLTTRATYESEKFRALCAKIQSDYPKSKITLKPCEHLAGKIERHLGEKEFDFTPFLPRGKPNAVVLGCTHYIYIEEGIKEFYHCQVFHGNDGIAIHLREILSKEGAIPTNDKKKERYRDGQPHLTTFQGRNEKNLKKADNFPQKPPKKDEIIFLGKCQVVNKTRYEQMFAYKTRQKMGVSGQKS